MHTFIFIYTYTFYMHTYISPTLMRPSSAAGLPGCKPDTAMLPSSSRPSAIPCCMYVRIYVCMYVCMYMLHIHTTCMRAYRCIHTHTHINLVKMLDLHAWEHTLTHDTSIHTFVCAHTLKHAHTVKEGTRTSVPRTPGICRACVTPRRSKLFASLQEYLV